MSNKYKHKNERYLVRRLLEGVAGWLTYKQAAGAKTLYCEHFLYPPIHDVAIGREWLVRAQEPIKRPKGKRGAPQTIDFMIFRDETEEQYPGLIFLEIKYLRNQNSSRELKSLADDMDKLKKINSSDVESGETISTCGEPRKILLVVAQNDDFSALASNKTKSYPQIVKMLAGALRETLPNSVYRSYVETRLKKEFHWHAIAFGEPAWPKLLSSQARKSGEKKKA